MYYINFYGTNGLPLVHATVAIDKWREGWNPKFSVTKADVRNRRGLRRVDATFSTEDCEVAGILFKLICEGAEQYFTWSDVYLRHKGKSNDEIKEFHYRGKDEE